MVRRASRFGWLLIGVPLVLLVVAVVLVRARNAPLRIGAAVEEIAFSPDGHSLSVASAGGVQVWSLPEGRSRREFARARFTAIAWSPDGELVAAAEEESGAIQVWSARDGVLLVRLAGHIGGTNQLAWSPDGTLLASAGRDRTVQVWRPRDGRGTAEQVLRRHSEQVRSVTFSADGRTLATGGYDGAVYLWQVPDGMFLRTLSTRGAEGIAFSPDSGLLATGGSEDVQLWRVADGTLVSTLSGHVDSINTLMFSPDGRFLASGAGRRQSGRGAQDTSVRLWRVSDGISVRVWRGHRDAVTSVAFSPDGRTLASGSADGTVRLWSVP